MDKMSLPQTHQAELIALAELAGISAVPRVHRVIMELLALHVSPEDIYILLKQIRQQSKDKEATENPEEIPNTLNSN
ncbi:uncharacterized protein LOC143360034 [Halictus rubicundus]|uniref:uncharacterized protein LOC143360034 n=1 Tax=Halictus rubicundus TaxID=77578 RepID=UPI00403664E8